jgi:primosomal replication protein N
MVPGIRVRLTGFLARKSRMSLQLVLHVNNLEPI